MREFQYWVTGAIFEAQLYSLCCRCDHVMEIFGLPGLSAEQVLKAIVWNIYNGAIISFSVMSYTNIKKNDKYVIM